MKQVTIRTILTVAFIGMIAVVVPSKSRAATLSTVGEAFQATQGLSYGDIVGRVNGNGMDGGPHDFRMVTDPRDVIVTGSIGNGFWYGRTNRLPNAPRGYRVYGGYFGTFIWGLVADHRGVPISNSWFFGTRENGRFSIWNFVGNQVSGTWKE